MNEYTFFKHPKKRIRFFHEKQEQILPQNVLDMSIVGQIAYKKAISVGFK